MAIKKKATVETKTLVISEIQMREATFHLLGDTPLIMHRFSQKAWQQLLLPDAPTNNAGREQTLKHDPLAEYRGAFYINRDEAGPAMFHLPNGMIHGSMGAAALDIPGATKAQVERLTRVSDINIDLYGVPRIFCSMVRNSGISRTPDVRTRPIFPEWACAVTVRWVHSSLTEKTVGALLGAAGQIIGMGDWRGEKGGPFGSWNLTGPGVAGWLNWSRIVETQGRAAQREAFFIPDYYDRDTEEILQWFDAEIARREKTDLLSSEFKLEPRDGLRIIKERHGTAKDAGVYDGEEERVA